LGMWERNSVRESGKDEEVSISVIQEHDRFIWLTMLK
jgi:hypothetical protein